MKRSIFIKQSGLALPDQVLISLVLLMAVVGLSPAGWAIDEAGKNEQQGAKIHALQTSASYTPKGVSNKPELVVQSGHSDEIKSLVFSPDSKVLASASADGTVRLWDVTRDRLVRTIDSSQYWVHSMAFSPKGTLLATGSGDNIVKIWDVRTGRQRKPLEGHSHAVTALAFSPDGYIVASGSGECGGSISRISAIILWDVHSGEKMDELPIGEGNVRGLTFLDDNTLVSVAEGKESVITVWDVKNRSLRKEIKVPIGIKDSLKLAMNIKNVAMLSSRTRVNMWELPSLHQKPSFAVDRELREIALLPDQHSLWMFTSRRIYKKDLETEVIEVMGEEVGQDFGQTIAVAPSGQMIAFVSQGKTIKVLGTKQGSVPRKLPSGSRSVRSMGFSHSGMFLASGMGDGSVSVWDMKQGHCILSFGDHAEPVHSIGYGKKDESIMTAAIDGQISLWHSTGGGKEKSLQVPVAGKGDPIERQRLASRCEINLPKIPSAPRALHFIDDIPPRSVMVSRFSPNMEKVIYGGYPNFISIWDFRNEKNYDIYRDEKNKQGVTALAFSSKRDALAFGDEAGRIILRGFPQESKMSRMEKHKSIINALAFSPKDEQLLASVSSDKSIILWNTETGEAVQTRQGHGAPILALAFSPTGSNLATGGADNKINIWKMPSLEHIKLLEGHSSAINVLAYAPDEQLLVSGSEDGSMRLWEAESGRELARLISMNNGTWFVVNSDGRFDTNNLEELPGLSWVMSDDPLRALPSEIFMRDYYEPKLLPRLLSGKKDEFKEIRPLQSLNRAQPQVKEIRLSPGKEPGTVTAEVGIEGGSYKFEQTGETKVTGAYDLRIFRDGQLVGQYPEPKESTPDGVSGPELRQWQDDTRVVKAGGKQTVTFADIKLPHASGRQPTVEFTAYAFNEDRVKGETAKATTQATVGKAAKKAYVVAIGVDEYGGLGWDLQYAAKDACRIVEVLGPRLARAGYMVEVTLLVSDETREQATKDKIRAAIEGLAGKSTPDDVVVFFFSGHGYSGEHSAFYLLPSDSQPGRESWAHPSPKALGRCISAKELSQWVQKVDAAEMVLIIDACHSAASIESEGFKPGPLGSRGLGQLAYDKRMRVLAASQSDQAAREMGGQIGAGVLTYTLLHDGLEANQAVDAKGEITLKSWLEYPVRRVPQLFQEIRAGKVNDYGVRVTRTALPAADIGGMQREGAAQEPALFDFTRSGGIDIILER